MTAPVPSPSTPVGGRDALRPARRHPLGRCRQVVADILPNIVVFAMLAGALVWGHQTGWKMPKVSQLRGAAGETADDWCPEHLVPESACVECNEELFPKPKEFGFCRRHGVAECVIDHPELAQVNGKPQLPRYDILRPLALLPRPENNSRNSLHHRRLQFASAESAAKAGIDVDVVHERPMTDAVWANGEVTFDPTRVAHLSSKAQGTVAVVFKTLGEQVAPGEILALVDAAEVGRIKSQFLNAIVQLQLRRTTLERLQGIAPGAVPTKSLIEAESALQESQIAHVSARQALVNLGFDLAEKIDGLDVQRVADDIRFLGIPPASLARLPGSTKSANLIPLRAPYEGVIVDSDVVAGEVVDASRVLFTVADPKKLWLILSVRPEDATNVVPGLAVVFRSDDASTEVTGTISWVSPAIDEKTRTLRVRVTLKNPDARLRDKTFGTGRIILRQEPHAVVVPRESVQSTGDAHFVFVRDRDFLKKDARKVFHVRQVRMGARDEQYVELLAGVLPGEVVATKGSPVLLAQLLRGNLGEGCGCHEH